MKKIFAIALCVFMLVSTLAVCASAEYTPVGEVNAYYEADLSDNFEWDGQLDDWADIDYIQLTADNMDAWAGAVSADFKITVYFAADAKYLYVAFWIDDSTPCAVPETATTNALDGDTFQIQLDLNNTFADSGAFTRAIYYSFTNREDGKMRLQVDASESGGIEDPAQSPLIDSWIWADEAEGTSGVHGAVADTATGSGWQAELAIPWQLLYDHQYYKAAHLGAQVSGLKPEEYPNDVDFANNDVKFEMSPDAPLSASLNICYLDKSGTVDAISVDMAAGTPDVAGQMKDQSGFFPENSGIDLIVTPTSEVVISDPSGERFTAEESSEDPSEEEQSSAVDEQSSEEQTTKPEEQSSTTEEQTTTPEKSGCGSVVGFGSVAVLALAIGAAAFKKKED